LEPRLLTSSHQPRHGHHPHLPQPSSSRLPLPQVPLHSHLHLHPLPHRNRHRRQLQPTHAPLAGSLAPSAWVVGVVRMAENVLQERHALAMTRRAPKHHLHLFDLPARPLQLPQRLPLPKAMYAPPASMYAAHTTHPDAAELGVIVRLPGLASCLLRLQSLQRMV
jgi:hypothetical protein